MRITLDTVEVAEVLAKLDTNSLLYTKILLQLNNEETKDKTKKRGATSNAIKSKVDDSKAKVLNAINALRMEGAKINGSTIATYANIDYKTANKYFKEFNIKG